MSEPDIHTNVLSFFKSQNEDGPFLVLTVAGMVDRRFLVVGPGINAEVQVSLSCLLVPEMGDTVLVYYGPTGATRFIISILARTDSSVGQIALPGANVIHSNGDGVVLNAPVISLSAQQSLELQAPHLGVSTHELDIKSQKLGMWIKGITVCAHSVSSVVKDIFTTAAQLCVRAQSSFRVIDDVDDTQSGHQRVFVKGRYRLQSESMHLDSRGFVRIDGDKIDLG